MYTDMPIVDRGATATTGIRAQNVKTAFRINRGQPVAHSISLNLKCAILEFRFHAETVQMNRLHSNR